MDTKNLTASQIRRLSEPEAYELLEAVRWPNGVVCPHCGSDKGSYKIKSRPNSKNKVRHGLHKCKDCRKPFTVKVGTVFEGSRIPLRDWLYVAHQMNASKKGVSAHQIHRELDITYKSAWFMCHRIREAMTLPPLARRLRGEVEADETYIGGRRKGGKRGRGSENKTPVFALIERGGELRAWPVLAVTAKNLKAIIRSHVDKAAHIMTDGFLAYKGLDKEFASHETVDHGKGEYARGRVHVNLAENWFSILKRGIRGVFHHVSPQHLGRYVGEFQFRYNRRGMTDIERTLSTLVAAEGRRLKLKDLLPQKPS